MNKAEIVEHFNEVQRLVGTSAMCAEIGCSECPAAGVDGVCGFVTSRVQIRKLIKTLNFTQRPQPQKCDTDCKHKKDCKHYEAGHGC